MTRIPLDPIGYSVNPSTGTIHTRYAGDHAGDATRTRTEAGARHLLGDATPKVCRTCYPIQAARFHPAQPSQVRRSAPTLPNVRDTDRQDTVPDMPEQVEQGAR